MKVYDIWTRHWYEGCSGCLSRAQESARLMASGDYEQALPVALEAVRQGEALFKPSPALQLFPLYLLAAQVGLYLVYVLRMLWCFYIRSAKHESHGQLGREL
jgi:hypothetical protein